MASEIKLTDSPSQTHRIRVNGYDVEILLRYNLSADRWSMTLWIDDSECPVLAGRVVINGINLFLGYDLDLGELYCVFPRAIDSTVDWYNRLVSGVARLIFITAEERESLSSEVVEVC